MWYHASIAEIPLFYKSIEPQVREYRTQCLHVETPKTPDMRDMGVSLR